MSHRDYANRTPQANGKKNRNRHASGKSSAMATRPKIPLLLIAFTLFSVGCFSYFLWNIKDNSNQANTQKNNRVSTNNRPLATSKVEPNALPPQPQEQWTYLDELENKEVKVDIPKIAKTPSNLQYLLQCASFRQASQAHEMKAKIAFQGLESQVQQFEGTSGTWYRVSLGPFTSKREAERQRHTLQKISIHGCQILALKP